jgi:hypothetical protein
MDDLAMFKFGGRCKVNDDRVCWWGGAAGGAGAAGGGDEDDTGF